SALCPLSLHYALPIYQLFGILVAMAIHDISRFEGQQSRLLHFANAFGNILAHRTVFAHWLTEHYALVGAFTHHLQSARILPKARSEEHTSELQSRFDL